jgi:micrococcal nuclease
VILRRIAPAFVGLLFWTAAVAGEAPHVPAGFTRDPGVKVAEVIDGDSLTLADGRTVRMVGIQAPKLAKGRVGFRDWPLSHEAEAALSDLAAGQSVTLLYGGARQDRSGRVLAQLERADGLWLEGELLQRGLARVYTFADNRTGATEMLRLEAEARAARRGIWDDPFYAVRKPEETLDHLDSFELVEGQIVDAARVRGTVFLNFGADWHKAFTVRLRPEAVALFQGAGLDPLTLKGETVRVRGYIRRDRDRAEMDVTHPEEIEKL